VGLSDLLRTWYVVSVALGKMFTVLYRGKWNTLFSWELLFIVKVAIVEMKTRGIFGYTLKSKYRNLTVFPIFSHNFRD